MTATRDRRGDLDEDRAEPGWDERPILGRSRGLPWWGAVLLAVGLTAVAAVIDMQVKGSLGQIFQGAYVGGCVAAVCLVRRRNLFGPIVQPPLVFAVVSVPALALFGPGGGGGLKGMLFNVALPLTSNFPTMGITTGVVLAIGIGRFFLQRDPEAKAVEKRPKRTEDKPRRPREDAPARSRPAGSREERARDAERKPRKPRPER
ncbi:DUF6542 domain-containing protein [Actinokineospora sp. UTMC 2448]|uniref:DUF6542 domain-containing protein n=1 Tax=Actinokineospora sp. UTMC 2448 TaxID=2268449 RepID=UPI002164E6C5|nr:DUF6542 domain-containing protein [Actinokineospora sp. UTMC 2448]